MQIGVPTGVLRTSCYALPGALGPEAGEAEAYAALQPLLTGEAFESGVAACCLCYGPTASGKTHTARHIAAAAASDLLKRFPAPLQVRDACNACFSYAASVSHIFNSHMFSTHVNATSHHA